MMYLSLALFAKLLTEKALCRKMLIADRPTPIANDVF